MDSALGNTAEQERSSGFRVLALDGGGIRGVYSAQVLASLERTTGVRCADSFDLVVGTSTGGLLALGIAMGFEAEQMASFYQQHGPKIFPHRRRLGRFTSRLAQLGSTKHSEAQLRTALQSVFGTSTIRDARTRLVIPSFDITEGRIFLFKSGHHEAFVHDLDLSCVDVAMATAAAPTFFPAKLVPDHGGVSYIDGGVWANTPTLVALVEAMSFLRQDIANVSLLSIGTTSSTLDFADRGRSGALAWGPSLVDLFMASQSQAASSMTSLLLGPRFHRIDASVPEHWRSLDSAARVPELVARGSNDGRKAANLEVVTRLFLNGTPTEPFRLASDKS